MSCGFQGLLGRLGHDCAHFFEDAEELLRQAEGQRRRAEAETQEAEKKLVLVIVLILILTCIFLYFLHYLRRYISMQGKLFI